MSHGVQQQECSWASGRWGYTRTTSNSGSLYSAQLLPFPPGKGDRVAASSLTSQGTVLASGCFVSACFPASAWKDTGRIFPPSAACGNYKSICDTRQALQEQSLCEHSRHGIQRYRRQLQLPLASTSSDCYSLVSQYWEDLNYHIILLKFLFLYMLYILCSISV